MSRAVDPWDNRPTDLELAVFEVIWRRYRRGETDLLEGGVPPAAVAREIGSTVGAVSEHCVRLRDEGVLVEVHGVDPERLNPRRSFVPAALVEDTGGEQR